MYTIECITGEVNIEVLGLVLWGTYTDDAFQEKETLSRNVGTCRTQTVISR